WEGSTMSAKRRATRGGRCSWRTGRSKLCSTSSTPGATV
ncbi:MAG: hypothetical protein AVDCRST_MAG18-1955, partial [uncultured Thermomicrobiales bacterium]